MTVVSPVVSSAVVNRLRCSELLLTIVVRCVDNASVKQEAGQLLFAVQNSCFIYETDLIGLKDVAADGDTSAMSIGFR